MLSLVLFAAACSFSVRLLVWCRPFPGARFDDVAHAAFGGAGRAVAAAAVLLSQLGFATSYFVFASQNVRDAAISFGAKEDSLPQGRVVLMLWCICALFQLVRRVERLQFVSVASAVAVLAASAAIFADGFAHHKGRIPPPWDQKAYGPWIKITFPDFFGIAAFSYCCQAVVGSLEDALRRAAVADMVRARVNKAGSGGGSGGGFEAAFEAWCNGMPLRTPSPSKRNGDAENGGYGAIPVTSSPSSSAAAAAAAASAEDAFAAMDNAEDVGEALPLLGTSPWPLASGANLADDIPFAGAEVSARRELVQVTDAAVASVTVLYVAFGAIGYMLYGDAVVNAEITELLHTKAMRSSVQLALSTCVVCSMPIMLMPVCDVLCPERVVGRAWPVARAMVVAAPAAAALALPCFSQVTALSGAVFNSQLSFLLPAACALALQGGQQDGLSPASRVGCIALILFGLAGVATAASVVLDLVHGDCQT